MCPPVTPFIESTSMLLEFLLNGSEPKWEATWAKDYM